jgi:hypothetical protein
MTIMPTGQRPFRIMTISGSGRRQYNCPGVDSKARTLMMKMAEMLLQEWEIDYEDLGNVYGRANTELQYMCIHINGALCMAL